MVDMDKVIKGLECCSTDAYKCNECPYIQHNPLTNICTGYVQICADALALLKEQKSVEPKTGHWICGKYDDIFMCSSCEKYSRDDYPYCHWCGAKMEQEGR